MFSDIDLLKLQPRLNRYARTLYRRGSICDPDDLVQDTLMRALSKRSLYVETADSDLTSWLCVMMHNLWAQKIRRRIREQECPVSLTHGVYEFNPESSILEKEIDKVLRTLPEEYSQVIQEVVINGESYEDVAQKINIPIGTVRSRLNRGRNRFKTYFEGFNNEKESSNTVKHRNLGGRPFRSSQAPSQHRLTTTSSSPKF